MDGAATFGRRGARPEPVFVAPMVAAPVESLPSAESRKWWLKLPLFTCGVLAILTLIFVVEMSVSAANGHPGQVVHSALLQLGGSSGDLVFGRWQVWRILTAQLLHANAAHLIGNGVALLLVGLLLEPIVGFGWFALIYCVGGVCGVMASLLLNPHGMLSVGASGAIMCVLSATLVLSFHAASAERRKRMRVLSIRVMVPALLPLSSSHGHVDYSAHIGGVVAGMVIGFLLQIFWAEDQDRPPQGRPAGWAGLAIGFCGLIALGLASVLPTSAVATTTPGLIPIDDLPTSMGDGLKRGAELAALYPADPRGHMYVAIGYLKARDDAEAVGAFVQALQSPLLKAPDLPQGLEPSIRVSLAGLYLKSGQTDDARQIAAPLCVAPAQVDPKAMELIRKARLCDAG